MAQRVEIHLVDDLDGSKASETVAFGIDGTTYEIDLSSTNAAKLRKALAPWIDKGRKAKPAKGAAKATASSSRVDRSDYLARVRTWARENGYEVGDFGRISREVTNAYDEAIAGRKAS